MNIEEQYLIEKTRQQLISKGKASDKYKDPKFANMNRYTRRNLSKIAATVADYNRLDMNAFFKGDLLDVGIKVHGETDDYVVTITIENALKAIRDNVQRNNNKLEFKCVYQALATTFNNGDVYVKCGCFDWKYRQAYYATKDGYSTDFPEVRASNITNPNDTKGGGCKHIMLVLGNIDWIMKVSSVITNYIYYCKDNMEYNYARFIFPVIYGMDYNKAVQMSIDNFGPDGEPRDDLVSDPAILNLANAIGKRRTQFKKGNPYRFQKKETSEPDNQLGLKFNNNQPQLKEPSEDEDQNK